MENLKQGDRLMDMTDMNEHIILNVEDTGYVTVQFEAFHRNKIEGGVNIIHQSEVDGVHIKKLP